MVNKIRSWTYLYKEIIYVLKDIGVIDVFAVNKNGEKMEKVELNTLYILEPDLEENIFLYNKLFKSYWEYIIKCNFNEKSNNTKKCINILDIGKKYKVYVSLKGSVTKSKLEYIFIIISSIIADDIVVNKISNIKKGIFALDIILNMGKDIYAIPGNIFEYKNYLSNFAIKQGAIPICGIYDVKYILLQKDYKKI